MARNPDSSVRILDLTDEAVAQLAAALAGEGGPISGTVALSAGTLAALEEITATVANLPGDYPDAAVLAKLEAIRAAVDGLEGFTDGIESALALLATDAEQTTAVARLTSLLAAVDDLEAITAGLASQTTAAAILAALASVAVTGPLTDAQLRATAVPVSFAADEAGLTDAELRAAAVPISGTVGLSTADFPDAAMAARTPDLSGTWGYAAGVDGTETVTGSKRIIGIAAHATTAATLTIDGGDSIPIPANVGLEFVPYGNLVDPVLVFTGTDAYIVEFLS